MKLKDIIKADKSGVEWGAWKSGSSWSRSAFPLKLKKAPFGPAYTWRVVKFSCLGRVFRILIFFHRAKEQYFALLGLEGPEMTVLAKYEFHGTHPGWHIHTECGEVSKIPKGKLKWSGQERLPSANRPHRNTEFGISGDKAALNRAAKFFRLKDENYVPDLFET